MTDRQKAYARRARRDAFGIVPSVIWEGSVFDPRHASDRLDSLLVSGGAEG